MVQSLFSISLLSRTLSAPSYYGSGMPSTRYIPSPPTGLALHCTLHPTLLLGRPIAPILLPNPILILAVGGDLCFDGLLRTKFFLRTKK
ncbi:hypothetical protein BDV59DRAFT_185762 [Aspergillus ambiguus]|uniref:uncharacterized protein n=1 Tax=Aspergillus ambiguus TaxID=176160 RepID=UPI003CCCD935